MTYTHRSQYFLCQLCTEIWHCESEIELCYCTKKSTKEHLNDKEYFSFCSQCYETIKHHIIIITTDEEQNPDFYDGTRRYENDFESVIYFKLPDIHDGRGCLLLYKLVPETYID